jgi:riboflavin transporter FmnP
MMTPATPVRRHALAWSLTSWVKVSLMSSLATVLMLALQVPLFPCAPFLTYDLSDVPAVIAGFAMGPWQGMMVVLLKNLLFLIQRPQATELIGIPMNIAAGVTMVGVSASFYWHRKSRFSALLGLMLGTVAMAALMIPVNLLVYPLFAWVFGIQSDLDLTTFVLGTVTPFNLLKGALTALLTLPVYKRFSSFLKLW